LPIFRSLRLIFYSIWYPVVEGDRIPYAVKYQSYAPEDGQNIARNILS